MKNHCCLKSLCLLGLVFLIGCGGSMSELSGTVTCDGAPVAWGRMTLTPELGGRDVLVEIQEGVFRNVTTSNKGDGLAKGKYLVSIRGYDRQPVGMEIIPSAIDTKYNNRETSGLTVEITGGVNEVSFDLDPLD